MDSYLAAVKNTKTILLTTYKRDGTAVGTPVSIAFDGDRAFFRSYHKAWKTKRLRNNPEVQVAPCTLRGRPTGPAVRARAILLDGVQARLAPGDDTPPGVPGPVGYPAHRRWTLQLVRGVALRVTIGPTCRRVLAPPTCRGSRFGDFLCSANETEPLPACLSHLRVSAISVEPSRGRTRVLAHKPAGRARPRWTADPPGSTPGQVLTGMPATAQPSACPRRPNEQTPAADAARDTGRKSP
jgi:hypothetical protein